jgi:hypothetical protein
MNHIEPRAFFASIVWAVGFVAIVLSTEIWVFEGLIYMIELGHIIWGIVYLFIGATSCYAFYTFINWVTKLILGDLWKENKAKV